MLTVETTVFVAHEVTVVAGHCEPVTVTDSVLPPVAVPLDFVEVEAPGVWEEGRTKVVGEAVADVPVCGTPHSSKLWPCAKISTIHEV